MKVCKYCTGIGYHHEWCTRPQLDAVNDPEGRALVQAIHDRKAAPLSERGGDGAVLLPHLRALDPTRPVRRDHPQRNRRRTTVRMPTPTTTTGGSMKAQELNGTHIGRTVAVIVAPGPVTISGPLAEIRHEAARISERKVCQAEETFVLGRPDVTVTFIDGMSATVNPEAKVALSEEAPKRGAHHLTEDHNGDPIYHCGWDPAQHTRPVVRTREQARNDIRQHIAPTKGRNSGHPDDDR